MDSTDKINGGPYLYLSHKDKEIIMEIERQYILKLRKITNHPTYEIYGAFCPKIALRLRAQQSFLDLLNVWKCDIK